MEACVAVIANSIVAFRSLFAGKTSQSGASPQDREKSAVRRLRQRKLTPNVNLPAVPSVIFSGLRSMMHKDPFADKETTYLELTLNGSETQKPRPFDTSFSNNDRSIRRIKNHFCKVDASRY